MCLQAMMPCDVVVANFIGEVIGLFSTFPTCLCLLSTMHMCCFLFIVLFFKLFFDVDCF